MAALHLLYEHPRWFEPLFAALDRRGLEWTAARTEDTAFDPADARVPAPLVLSRIAMSSPQRAPEHPIFHSMALLSQWEANGARVLNGSRALAIDSSKARQLALLAGLGLATPRTRVVHRAADVPAAAKAIGFPLLVKANIGGAGAGITRYDSPAELADAVAAGTLPASVDHVLLVQELVPIRDGRITRLETLAGRFLYAIDIAGGGGFDLCPADACAVDGAPLTMTAVDPGPTLVDAAERIAAAAHLDLGGIEVMVDDRTGQPFFYDINALSNFVANPHAVLGYDPHDRLADWLATLAHGKAAA